MTSSDDEAPPLALPLSEAAPPSCQTAAEPVPLAIKQVGDTDGDYRAPVPVTIITGYLGAGKTTLVNFILNAKHGCRCAVMLNEIGDSADVERALVKEPEGREASPLADWVELENGCICCSSKNDMVKALEALLQQRDRFEYIIIETTGLANPGPVAAALWTDAELESSVCLDAVVTVVDAKNIQRQLRDAPDAEAEAAAAAVGGGAVNEAQQQLAFADVVLLNKVDLVSEQQLGEVIQEIGAINADATVLPCHRCEVDLRHILNTGIYSGSLRGPRGEDGEAQQQQQGGGAGATSIQVGAAAAAAATPGSGGGSAQGSACEHGQAQAEGCEECAAAHEPSHHSHSHAGGEPCSICKASGEGPAHQQGLAAGSRVRTVSLVLGQAPLDLHRLRHWLDELLWEERSAERPDVFRVKGLLWVAGSGHKHICQGVHDIYDVVEGPAWQQGAARYSKLVFIGRRLDRGQLERALRGCLAAEVPSGE